MADTAEKKFVKLHVPGEGFWAEDLGDGTYRVDNVLLSNVCGLNDIVKAADGYEVTEVVKRAGRTVWLKYDGQGDSDEVNARYRRIRDHFQTQGCLTEGMVAGYAAVMVPTDVTDAQVQALAASCPEKVELQGAEEE